MTGDFDTFWRIYPNQTGIGAARKSFAAEIFFKSADPAQIIAATKAYAQKHKDTDKRYIPRPARYLDDQTYLDPDLQIRVTLDVALENLTGKQALLLAAIGSDIYLNWFSKATWQEAEIHLERAWYKARIENHMPLVARALKELGLTLC